MNEFHDDFVSKFSKFVPEMLGENAESFWKLKIPYVPYYAFKELVSVREIGKAGSEDLINAFYSLANAMAIFDQSLNKAIQSKYNEVNVHRETAIDKYEKHGIISKNGILAILPAFNEEVSIGSVVLQARSYVDRVIVVDDGSSDRTAEVAERAGAEVIRHPVNRGKGAALKTGFESLEGEKVVVTMDTGGQHNPSDIPKLIEPILKGEADMVNGSRYINGNKKDTPLYRRLGQIILDNATRLDSGLNITDSQSGFRAFAASTTGAFRFKQNGLAIESEMLADAANAGLRIKEVEIGVRYDVDGSSENPVSHGVKVLVKILQDVELNRPLYYFTVPGIVLSTIGIAFGLDLLRGFYHTGTMQFGPTLLTIALTLVGSIMAFTGVLLHSISKMINESRKKDSQTSNSKEIISKSSAKATKSNQEN